MKLKSIYLTLMIVAFSLARATENDDGSTIVNIDTFVDITGSVKVPNFTYNFHSYDCPKQLSTAVTLAVTSSIVAGRYPILVSDIDETLIKRPGGLVSSTDLCLYLSTSGAISNSYGVLALTARPVAAENAA